MAARIDPQNIRNAEDFKADASSKLEPELVAIEADGEEDRLVFWAEVGVKVGEGVCVEVGVDVGFVVGLVVGVVVEIGVGVGAGVGVCSGAGVFAAGLWVGW